MIYLFFILIFSFREFGLIPLRSMELFVAPRKYLLNCLLSDDCQGILPEKPLKNLTSAFENIEKQCRLENSDINFFSIIIMEDGATLGELENSSQTRYFLRDCPLTSIEIISLGKTSEINVNGDNLAIIVKGSLSMKNLKFIFKSYNDSNTGNLQKSCSTMLYHFFYSSF